MKFIADWTFTYLLSPSRERGSVIEILSWLHIYIPFSASRERGSVIEILRWLHIYIPLSALKGEGVC